VSDRTVSLDNVDSRITWRHGLTARLYNAGDQTTWWSHGSTGGVVGPSASATGAVRPPEDAIRLLTVVIRVPALRRVPMGESIRSILDKIHNR
jgi:hypothetical protein